MTRFPTRRAFKAWLAAQPPETPIACNWSICDCPLAKFTGYSIDPYYREYSEHKEGAIIHDLPKWAVDFANMVDYHNDSTTPITAAECLNILERS